MVKPHTITMEQLKDTVIKYQIAGSFGKGENKELVFTYHVGTGLRIWFVNDRSGTRPFTAVEDAIRAYNEAT